MANKTIALELKYPAVPSCTCKLCKAQCHRPGWMTVDEAKAAIAAGQGAQLMLEYFETMAGPIYVLCPANPGYEGKRAAYYGGDGCVFQTPDGLCSIHDSGYKPLECRAATHDPYKARPGDIREDLAREWAGTEGVTVVSLWWQEFNTVKPAKPAKPPRKPRRKKG